MQTQEYRPWATLVTCLAQYRTKFWPLPETTHHCSLPLPHAEHRCPCGTRWKGE